MEQTNQLSCPDSLQIYVISMEFFQTLFARASVSSCLNSQYQADVTSPRRAAIAVSENARLREREKVNCIIRRGPRGFSHIKMMGVRVGNFRKTL